MRLFNRCKGCNGLLFLLLTSFYQSKDRCDDCELEHRAVEAFEGVQFRMEWDGYVDQHGGGSC